MASRSSRSSVKEPVSAKKERPPSPLSPTKISRTEEKKQLGALNDRLAAYIDKVRSLELDNGRLSKKISSIEEEKTSELTTVRSRYVHELNSARRALDDEANKKAKVEMEWEKAKREVQELKEKLKDKENEIDRLNITNKRQESTISDLRTKVASDKEELRILKPEIENLKAKLEDARQKLEDETLNRIDLQNRLQTTQEENAFNSQILEQQLNESKVRKQIEIEEVDSRVQANYEEKLAANLKELRDAYESKMEENKREFSVLYDRKIADLSSRLASERGSAASAVQEMKEMTTRVEGMTGRVTELETTNSALQRRLKELTDQMDEMGRNHRSDMAQKNSEIDYLNDHLNTLTKEYQELLEIKIALDMEIAAYKKLLDGEEERMAYSPEPGRGVKRKRIDTTDSFIGTSVVTDYNQPGAILIEPLDDDKKCIKLTNTGSEEISLAGWQLKCQSEGLESSYKFTRFNKLAPGATIGVWGSESEVEHNIGKGQLVMKTGSWQIGDEVDTMLLDKEGEEVASRHTIWQKEIKGETSSYYGDSVLAARKAEQEKCIVM